MIFGERIRQARELCGITQKALADSTAVNQSAIAQIESGRTLPSQSLLQRIAERTQVCLGFFELEPMEDFSVGSLLYRARNSVTLTERNKAYQYTKLTVERIQEMARSLNLPDLLVPRAGSPPAASARLARYVLGIEPGKPSLGQPTRTQRLHCFGSTDSARKTGCIFHVDYNRY